MYHPQSGKLTISGDVDIYADGGVGVLMRAGTAEITGGTITGTGTAAGWVGDNNGSIENIKVFNTDIPDDTLTAWTLSGGF